MARISPTEYARRKGIANQYIFKLIKEGRLKKGKDGKLDEAKADAAIAATSEPSRADLKKHAASGNGHGGRIYEAYTKSRAEEKEYAARLKRLQYLAKRGDLIPAAKVRQQAYEVAHLIQQRLLILPDRVARIFGSSDPEKIRRVTEEFRAILQDMTDEIKRHHGEPAKADRNSG